MSGAGGRHTICRCQTHRRVHTSLQQRRAAISDEPDRPNRGHSGGPPLDEPTPPAGGRCKHCRHWHAPPEGEQRTYEAFWLDLSRRRVKRPTDSCDRALLGSPTTPTFSATSAEFSCGNFDAKPPAPPPTGGGFVTVWKNGRIAWEGPEETLPARFLQQNLDLFGSEQHRAGRHAKPDLCGCASPAPRVSGALEEEGCAGFR